MGLGKLAKGFEAESPIPAPAQREYVPFDWTAGGIRFSFEFLDQRLRIQSILPESVATLSGMRASTQNSGVETAIHCTGENVDDHHGLKFTGGMPGVRMTFSGKSESVTSAGKRMVITHADAPLGLKVESIYECYNDIPVIRRFTRITNVGQQEVGIEYASSAMLNNLAAPREFEQVLLVHYAFNTWQAEGQWHASKPSQIGFVDNGGYSPTAATFSSLGTWSTCKYLPIGMVENRKLGVTWFWQIEHNGSWHWELANTSAKAVYAYVGGPDAQHAQAWRRLMPGRLMKLCPWGLGVSAEA